MDITESGLISQEQKAKGQKSSIFRLDGYFRLRFFPNIVAGLTARDDPRDWTFWLSYIESRQACRKRRTKKFFTDYINSHEYQEVYRLSIV